MTPMPHDTAIEYLAGQFPADTRPRSPFAADAVAFLADLASTLRKDSSIKGYPDLVAAAFWCRKGHLQKLQERFEDGTTRLGRGLAFHVAPGNVPVNFLYSFAFSLLAGCANIVRLPSRDTPSLTILLGVIRALFDKPEHAAIAASNAFVRYSRGHTATDQFSARCDARLIWGGDATINDIRRCPIPSRAVELTFPDRFSFSVISEHAVMAAAPDQLARLAQGFFNDAFIMDQQACSSPHLLVWTDQTDGGRNRFWAAVGQAVQDQYAMAPIQGVDRHERLLSNFLKDADQRLVTQIEGAPLLRVQLAQLPKDAADLRGVSGLFYEVDVATLAEIAPIVSGKYQTLTYYGLEKSGLSDFVINSRLSGIDRIVPVGTALDIDTIWDGVDVLKSLSRIIDVR